MSPFSMEVVDLLLNDIDFDPEFKKAIEDKQIATQGVLEESLKVDALFDQARRGVVGALSVRSRMTEEEI